MAAAFLAATAPSPTPSRRNCPPASPSTRQLSGTPAIALPATLYTYSATDSDATAPDSASLTFTITGEALASVTISTGAVEVDEGDDRTPVAGGSTRAATMLTPIRDLEAEGDETIRLEIDSVAGRGEIGAPAAVRVDISLDSSMR